MDDLRRLRGDVVRRRRRLHDCSHAWDDFEAVEERERVQALEYELATRAGLRCIRCDGEPVVGEIGFVDRVSSGEWFFGCLPCLKESQPAA